MTKGGTNAMRIAGIIIGILGAVLFIWHAVKVVMGTDIDSIYASHTVLSLVGGVMVFAGTWLYVLGRRRPSSKFRKPGSNE